MATVGQQLLAPVLNEVHSMNDIKSIGDCIPCRYTSLISGQVGVFSELGTTTTPLIPVTSSATPDGSFNWIYVGKDYLGRKKFIADRNIQHSISWDTLNSVGIVSEKQINFSVTATASTDTNSAIRAFDGIIGNNDNNTLWSVNTDSAWLQADYINYNSFNSFRIISGDQSQAPKSIVVKGSNTGDFLGEEETLLNTGTIVWTVNNGTLGGENTFTLDSTCNYRYVRYYLTNRAKPLCIKVSEIITNATLKNKNNNKYYLRLLTGGTSATDTDNEWDQIIVNSNLNNIITAGDNDIWNWDLNVYTWCSTTDLANNANRIRRGGPGNINKFTSSASSYAASYGGFRPVLLVEEAQVNYPIINNPIKTMLDNRLNISVDNITHKSSLPVKVKVYITKPNEFIVMKREYDAEFQPTPFTINNINFNIDEFDIGTNTITINVKDSNGLESNWSTNIIKSNTNKLLLLDGNKLKSSNLELLSEDYLSVEDNNLKQLFLTKGSTNNIKFNDDFKSQVENKDALKLLVLNIDLLK